MSIARDMKNIVVVPFTCPKCGHHVMAEIDFRKPLMVGNQCPRCVELYPQEFSNEVLATIEAHFAEQKVNT